MGITPLAIVMCAMVASESIRNFTYSAQFKAKVIGQYILLDTEFYILNGLHGHWQQFAQEIFQQPLRKKSSYIIK